MSELPSVDLRPSWLINIAEPGSNIGTVAVDGISYPYTVVSHNLEPRLPYLIGYPETNALFISSNVPAAWRKYIMAHEVRHETTYAKLPKEDACIAALSDELRDVAKGIPYQFQTYIYGNPKEGNVGRLDFFRSLSEFINLEDQRAGYSDEFRAGVQKSLDYLANLRTPIY